MQLIRELIEAVKDESHYKWFEYTGSGMTLEKRGRTVDLVKGTRYGIRGGGGGTFRVIVADLGPTHVFTVDEATYEILVKDGNKADVGQSFKEPPKGEREKAERTGKYHSDVALLPAGSLWGKTAISIEEIGEEWDSSTVYVCRKDNGRYAFAVSSGSGVGFAKGDMMEVIHDQSGARMGTWSIEQIIQIKDGVADKRPLVAKASTLVFK